MSLVALPKSLWPLNFHACPINSNTLELKGSSISWRWQHVNVLQQQPPRLLHDHCRPRRASGQTEIKQGNQIQSNNLKQSGIISPGASHCFRGKQLQLQLQSYLHTKQYYSARFVVQSHCARVNACAQML